MLRSSLKWRIQVDKPVKHPHPRTHKYASTYTVAAGLWIWVLASDVSHQMNRAASGRHLSPNLSVFFPGVQHEEGSAVEQLTTDHRGAIKTTLTLCSSGSSVSFCSFYLRGNKTAWDQRSTAELQHGAARLQWRSSFRSYLEARVWASKIKINELLFLPRLQKKFRHSYLSWSMTSMLVDNISLPGNY